MESNNNNEENQTPSYMFLPSIKHQLSLSKFRDDMTLKNKYLEIIKLNNMPSYYKQSCQDLNWNFDRKLYDSMKKINLKISERDFESSQDELDFYLKTGEIEKGTATAFNIMNNESSFICSDILRLNAGFCLFRLGFMSLDMPLMKKSIQKLKKIIELNKDIISSSTWYYKNKLKVYEGICRISRGNFEKSANLLLDCISTFESHELVPFKKIIEYMTIAGTLSWTRSEIKKNMIDNGEFRQSSILQDSNLDTFFTSFYNCQYNEFLKNLNSIILERMKQDPLLHLHGKYYMREIKIRAYSQILNAYSSITLREISQEFDIPIDVIEQDVVEFSQTLNCKIDKISQCAHIISSTSRENKYKELIKSGNLLLNKVQILFLALLEI